MASLPKRDTVHVVIPAAGKCADLVRQCVVHLDGAGAACQICLVNNGTTEATRDAMAAALAASAWPNEIIDFAGNRGFTAAINAGLERSEGRHSLLLNTDAFIDSGCVKRLLDAICEVPDVAAAGPLTNDKGHQSTRLTKRSKLQNTAARTPEDMLAFFCCLLHGDALDDLGPLDDHPDYASGLCADDEWCQRATASGYKLLCVHDAFCSHLHSETFRRLGIDRQAEHIKAGRRLRGV